VTVEYNNQSFRGLGISTDIVEAGAIAYLEVINRVCRRMMANNPETGKPAEKVATI